MLDGTHFKHVEIVVEGRHVLVDRHNGLPGSSCTLEHVVVVDEFRFLADLYLAFQLSHQEDISLVGGGLVVEEDLIQFLEGSIPRIGFKDRGLGGLDDRLVMCFSDHG